MTYPSMTLVEKGPLYGYQIDILKRISKPSGIIVFSYVTVKRVCDIIVSIIALVVTLIPMLVISAVICLDSEGPAIYKQERLGLNGKAFTMYKFRSMYMDAEQNGPQWASKNDSRCTRVGTFLRKTRLDELPQFFNILKGDMSLVGPRPERSYFYDLFESYIPGFKYRLIVKPGLTGLAQVSGGYDLLPEEKIIYDMEYISNQSFIMDAKCILSTTKLIFTHSGAR